MGRLSGMSAVVTGGALGIGGGTARRLARDGADVLIVDIEESAANANAERIRSAGGNAVAITGDVAQEEAARGMVERAVAEFGRLDILVNSAGIATRNIETDDSTVEELWDKVIEVNLKGTFLVSWAAHPEMVKAGGGSIINLSSIIGLVGHQVGFGSAFNPYAASKGGVIQFTRNLALHVASDKVRVNAICPGYTVTTLTETLTGSPETMARLESMHPMGRLGQPEEMAAAALYLASDESSYVTGTYLAVDGGYTAQ